MFKQLGDLIARIKVYAKSKTVWGVLVGTVVFVMVVRLLWIYKTRWTGFGGKTLWDLLDLLIVPLVLAVGAFLLSRAENRTEREIAAEVRKAEWEMAAERRREEALQNYLDRMTELMLEKGLRQSEGEPENKEVYEAARDVARARTLTILRVLDGERKGILLRFLHESELIRKGDEQQEVVVTLHEADLFEADLFRANLSGADLSGAHLFEANLCEANLREVSLREVYLDMANLSGADLSGADLSGANLNMAHLDEANLSGANLRWADLSGANLRKANLGGAHLSGAHLEEANLSRARLIRTNLSKTKLFDADLSRAVLFDADLSRARLIRTNLSRADLRETDLSGADLSGADLSEANLSEANLSGAGFSGTTTLPNGTKWTPDTDMTHFTDPQHPDFWQPDRIWLIPKLQTTTENTTKAT